jgi:hypothetical protein
MAGSLCAACASGGVQNVHTNNPALQASGHGGPQSTRYTSRVMSLADTRGVSVMWFNAPIEAAEVAPAAPVACASPTKN